MAYSLRPPPPINMLCSYRTVSSLDLSSVRIRDVYPRFYIPDPTTTKRGDKKLVVLVKIILLQYF